MLHGRRALPRWCMGWLVLCCCLWLVFAAAAGSQSHHADDMPTVQVRGAEFAQRQCAWSELHIAAAQVVLVGVTGDLSRKYLIKSLLRLQSAMHGSLDVQLHGVS